MKVRKRKRGEEQDPVAAPPDAGLNPRARHALAGLALCALSLFAYANSFQTGLAYDNEALLLHIPQIREATYGNLALMLQHSFWWPMTESGLYRPFTSLTFLFNFAVLGNADRTPGYHWFNFILHVINVLMVYILASRLLTSRVAASGSVASPGTRSFWLSFWIAAVWAVHPVLTEGVTNIVGRADELAATGVLSGFLFYRASTQATGRRRIAMLAGVMASTALGVFSKESAVAIVGVILLYELTWWRERRPHLTLLWGCLAMLPPLVLMLFQRSHVLAHKVADLNFVENPVLGATFWQWRLTAVKVIARYLLVTIWPAKLSADYSYSEIPLASGTFQDWISWLVVIAVIAGIVMLYGKNRTAFFFAAFAAVTFAPVSNLFVPSSIMAERFLYLPSIGIVACAVIGIYAAGEKMQRPALIPVALSLMTVAFMIRTLSRNLDWQDNLSLSIADVQAAPGSFKTHQELSEVLFRADPSLPKLDRIIMEGEKSVGILDGLPNLRTDRVPYLDTADYYIAKGDLLRGPASAKVPPPTEAIAAYQRGFQLAVRGLDITNEALGSLRARQLAVGDPTPIVDGDSRAYRLVGKAYERLGDLNRALEMYDKSRALDPMNAEIHSLMGSVLLSLNRLDDAATALAEGILITSDLGLKQQLFQAYRDRDPKGCEITQGPAGYGIDPRCEKVHKAFCGASVDALKASVRAEQWELSAVQKQSLLRDYGCPAAPLDQVFPDHK